MSDFHQTDTVTIKACCRCSSGLLERDRFCRWCGACQTEETSLYKNSTSPYTTSALGPGDEQAAPFRPVSGPLVQAMIAGMPAAENTPHYSRAIRGLVQVLVSIPIWLMIVLLSPFDAYVSARTISRHS